MDFDNLIKSIDDIEGNRKADYSIWGYLYQFDITLFDCINQFSDKDYFGDEFDWEEVSPAYQIETLEDYMKAFCISEKNYIRLYQVKYSSTAKSIDLLSPTMDLYYSYLLISKYSEGTDIKSGIIYHTKIANDDKISIEDLEKKISSITGNEVIENNLPVEEYLDVLNKISKHEKRVEYVFKTLHSKKNLEEFHNRLYYIWETKRVDLINKIKGLLINRFDGFLSDMCDEYRGDILYSISIGYIINKWQSKKNKKDIIKITYNELENKIEDMSANLELVMEEYYNNTLRTIITENIEQYRKRLVYIKIPEDKIKEIMDIYSSVVADVTYKSLISFIKDKEGRYQLLLTIIAEQKYTKEGYLGLSDIDEFIFFIEAKEKLKNYVRRIMKFLYDLYIKEFKLNELDELFTVNKDHLFFMHPSERRSCILFPGQNTDDDDLVTFIEILNKLRERKLNPKVWYFSELKISESGNKKIHNYNYDFTKPGLESVKINMPSDEKFYIECMDCMDISSPNVCSDMNCIFEEDCKDGSRKN